MTIHCMVQMATSPAALPIHNAMDHRGLQRRTSHHSLGGRPTSGTAPLKIPHPAPGGNQNRPGENGGPWSYHLHHRANRLGQRTCLQQKGQRWSTSLSRPKITEPVHQEDAPQDPEEITNRLSGSKVFSKLNAKHGYWSIKLNEELSKLTTFNSPI